MLAKREIEFSIRKAEPGVWGEAKVALGCPPPPPSGGTDPSRDGRISPSARDHGGSGRDGGGSGGDGGGSGRSARDGEGSGRDGGGSGGDGGEKRHLFHACGAPKVNTCVCVC